MRPLAAVPTLPLSRFLAIAAVAVGPAALPARAATAEGLDPARRSGVIERTLELLREKYVFPDVAEAMAKAVEEKDTKGGYDAMESASHLALTLTSDLQAVSHDRHLRVLFHPPASMFSDEDDAEAQARGRRRAVHENFGFRSVQRLPGNVGYIDLRNFHSVEHGGATATAAMNLVANSDALIFDLRQNGGGEPGMVALIASYLFGPEPVHLNDLYWREDDETAQYWTLPLVPGKRIPDTPVYVLTSGSTFSAAEEFTYDLQCLGRATIVGETTGGGAHPGGSVAVDEEFTVWIPMGRAINPVTGKNWEGTGVEPDVPVPARAALESAHMMALEGLLAGATEDWQVAEIQAELERLRARIGELASPR